MENPDRTALVEGTRQLLCPLASLLLKCGMTWRDFAEIAKTSFVQMASRDYGIRGRPTNISRVAILTGIGRREVGKIREALEQAAPPLPNHTTDATRLLSGWHQDPAFAAADGTPRELPVAGEGPSFEELARRFAPDVPPTSILKELKRVGAVAELPDGRLQATRRYYQPTVLDAQWLLNAGSVFADLGNNINHNLGAAGSRDGTWFLGRATSDAVDPRATPAFRAFLEEEGQRFLERVDEWLTQHAADAAAGDDKAQDHERVRLGVGLFMIKGASDKDWRP